MTGPFNRLRSTSETIAQPSGRAVVVLVFVGALAIAGGYGYLVGSIGPKALQHIRVFGVTVFHPTPLGMAFYGMSIAALVLGTIAIAAQVAKRVDDQAPPE